jgi:preprotein translocase subunit SecD
MRPRFITPITLLLLLSVGLACSLLRPRSRLTWHLLLESEAPAANKDQAIEQTINVIKARLDALGIHEPNIATQGSSPNVRILVSLPDVPDRERLKRVITDLGLLELTAVVSPPSPAPPQTFSTQADAIDSLGGKVPENRRVLPYFERTDSTANQNPAARPKLQKWVVVEAPAIVDGSEIRSASAYPSQAGEDLYQIMFSLRQAGADKFGAWTGAHVNDYVGVVLNGEVKTIAFIRSQISDQGEITGNYTKQTAEDLALILRSGALPAPVRIVEEGANR